MGITKAFLFVILMSQTLWSLQVTKAEINCLNSKYYNDTLNQWCCNCNQDFVKRYPCVTDERRHCMKPCSKGYYINWEEAIPQCAACVTCSKDHDLIEKQKCSLQSAAICECQPGFYCTLPSINTCARCRPHLKCKPGFGVKKKGTAKSDTECEECPNGTYSNISSAKEGCIPHTESATQIVHKQREATETLLSLNFSPSTEAASKNPSTVPHPGNTVSNPVKMQITTEPLVTTKKLDTEIPVYVVAAIICSTILVIYFLFLWKQVLCKGEQCLLNKNGLASCSFCFGKMTTFFNHIEESKETMFFGKENESKVQTLALESKSCLKEASVPMEKEWLVEEKTDMQSSDQMNNRIEKIYIMKAETVVVGSRQISVSTDSESQSANYQDNTILASHYPEQESSKVSPNELMLSIEEEGKAFIDTEEDTVNISVKSTVN
uniref:TNFR-Cys domain-containing protein n=1 Tax=Xenopus tropicalis TaxID=8364 RepID=A0A803K014_XENTR